MMSNYSFVAYAGDGGTGPFAVPFPYLDQTHVAVSVDGVSAAHSWPTTGSVQLDAAAPSGALVEIRRTTPRDDRLVDFADGAILTEADLDTAILQQMYLCQEALDAVENTATLASDGTLDADGKRISNVGTPTADADAATKAYADAVAAAVLLSAAAASGFTLSGAPSDGQVIVYNASSSEWDPTDLVVTLEDDAVTTSKIADDAVTTLKILDDAVTAAKIPDGALSYAKMTSAALATAAADWRAKTASKLLTATGVWAGMAEVTLTDGANISLDLSSGYDFTVTLGGSRTLDNPTNIHVGQKGRIRVVQDGTGSRTLSYGGYYEFAGGTAPTLTAAASSEDILYYDVISSTRILITGSVADVS